MVSLFLCLSLKGQEVRPTAKLSPVLNSRMQGANKDFRISVRLIVAGNSPFHAGRNYYPSNADAVFFVDTTLSIHQLQHLISKLPGLIYVDAKRTAREEYLINQFDLGVNAIDVVHDRYPELNGEGITVSVRETRVDTSDIDLHGRYRHTTLAPRVSNSHATIMATMVAGAGNSGATGKGAAPAATVTSASYESLFPDPIELLQSNKVTVQNHSYGVGLENYYGADAAAYDAMADSVLLHVFSAGNSGLLKDSITRYPQGFANLTGSFKMAKNILTVGSTDSFRNVLALSSRGPAFDGRVKPELVAYGIDGSSGAAALVSGTAVLLQQQYRDRFGLLPASALVKAVLINSADDVGNPGPDYVSGYGSLHALGAVNTISTSAYFQGSITNGESRRFSLPVPSGANAVKCTLVWDDPAAAPNAPRALVNDLDLELVNTSTGEVIRPWVLTNGPSRDELTRPAGRGRDSLNNVEQISAVLQPGYVYELRVNTGAPLQGRQSFYLVYDFQSPDLFDWESPMKSIPLTAGNTLVFRWKSSYGQVPGKLSWSSDSGRSWNLINAGVELGKQHFEWTLPAINAAVLFRMEIASASFLSDTVVLAEGINTGVGFNCADSVLFYWNKLKGIDNYVWYRLGEKYMEPSRVTSDSFVVITRPAFPSLYYAAAPIINGRTGPRSAVLNYTQQGVGCYLRSFLVSEQTASIVSRFELGSLYNVKRMLLEKLRAGRFVSLREFSPDVLQSFSFRDTSLTNGLNTYRVKIELASGASFYSSEESVFHFGRNRYVVYPNPVINTRKLIVVQQLVAPATLEVYNVSGIRLYSQLIDDRINELQAGRFPAGIYFFRITSQDGNRETLKVIIQ